MSNAATKKAERPDLAAWRRRNELRRSNAARPVSSGTAYKRKPKHANRAER